MISRTLWVIVLTVWTTLGIQLGYIYGFRAGWNAVECVDVTDPDNFVRLP